jgi:hypothetical protein
MAEQIHPTQIKTDGGTTVDIPKVKKLQVIGIPSVTTGKKVPFIACPCGNVLKNSFIKHVQKRVTIGDRNRKEYTTVQHLVCTICKKSEKLDVISEQFKKFNA